VFVIHRYSYANELIILAWLANNMSTHGGEETWSRNPERLIIQTGKHMKHDPWETDQTTGKKREKNKEGGRDIYFKSHLSRCKHGSLIAGSADVSSLRCMDMS